MDEYCRFCAEKAINLSNVLDMNTSILDWFVKAIHQELDLRENDPYLDILPNSVCYSCLCTIEDINFYIEKCRNSVVKLQKMWKKLNFIEKDVKSENECEDEENYEIDRLHETTLEKEKDLEMLTEDTVDNSINGYENKSSVEDDDPCIDMKKEFKCKECSKTFENSIKLMHHGKQHTGFLCTECGATFDRRANFSYHLKKHKEKPFSCDFCSKSFMTKFQLSSHKWTHSRDGPDKHQCDECSKNFRSHHELKIHRRFHKNIRPFKCEICAKGFVVKTHLKQHMVAHTGEKRHLCSYAGCNKSYNTGSSLKKHFDKHLNDDEKPLSCEYCSRKFSMHFILQDHIRKSHKKLLNIEIEET